MFNELAFALRTLYGPMNLAMSFHALCFGKDKFFALGKGVYSQLGNMHWKVDKHLKYLINFPKRKYSLENKIFQLNSDLENFLAYLIFP